jgi:hypothetical protein
LLVSYLIPSELPVFAGTTSRQGRHAWDRILPMFLAPVRRAHLITSSWFIIRSWETIGQQFLYFHFFLLWSFTKLCDCLSCDLTLEDLWTPRLFWQEKCLVCKVNLNIGRWVFLSSCWCILENLRAICLTWVLIQDSIYIFASNYIFAIFSLWADSCWKPNNINIAG